MAAYTSKLQILSVIVIVLGILAFLFQTAVTITEVHKSTTSRWYWIYDPFHLTATGVWTGVLLMVTGIMGLASACLFEKNSQRAMGVLYATIVLNIIAAFCSVAMTGLNIAAQTRYSWSHCEPTIVYQRNPEYYNTSFIFTRDNQTYTYLDASGDKVYNASTRPQDKTVIYLPKGTSYYTSNVYNNSLPRRVPVSQDKPTGECFLGFAAIPLAVIGLTAFVVSIMLAVVICLSVMRRNIVSAQNVYFRQEVTDTPVLVPPSSYVPPPLGRSVNLQPDHDTDDRDNSPFSSNPNLVLIDGGSSQRKFFRGIK